MHFVAHGEGKVYWHNNHLYVEPIGPFNLKGALFFNEQIENVVVAKPVEHWCRFEIFNSLDTLGPMEAVASLNHTFVQSKKHGCSLVCLVGGNIAMRETIKAACNAIELAVIEFDTVQNAEHYALTIGG